MGRAKEILNKFNEGPDNPSNRLISKIHKSVLGDKIDGPKFSKVTGAFSVLSLYFKDVKKVSDPDERLEMIRNAKEKDLPSFDDIKKFMMKNKKALNLK